MPDLVENLLRVSRIVKPVSGLALLGSANMVSDVGHDFDIKATQD